MADFTDAFLDLLPEFSNLRKSDNSGRVVIDRTVGEWFDRNTGISFAENLFLNTATGGFLDLFGRDYSVPRKTDEGDEDYRNRIIFEKLEYLTVQNLQNIYGLTLYAFVDDFDARDNCLTSDNPYISSKYMSVASDELQGILNSKFVLDGEIVWLVGDKIVG